MLSLDYSDPIFHEAELHGIDRKTFNALVQVFETEFLREPTSFIEMLEVLE